MRKDGSREDFFSFFLMRKQLSSCQIGFWGHISGGSIYAIRAFATPIFVASATPIFVASATPIFVASATPYFRISATQTAATPKILF